MIDSYRSADVAAVLDLYGGLVVASHRPVALGSPRDAAASRGGERGGDRAPAGVAATAQGPRPLLDLGADPAATAPSYGGALTTAELLDTSAHPRAAGVIDAVARVLSAG